MSQSNESVYECFFYFFLIYDTEHDVPLSLLFSTHERRVIVSTDLTSSRLYNHQFSSPSLLSRQTDKLLFLSSLLVGYFSSVNSTVYLRALRFCEINWIRCIFKLNKAHTRKGSRNGKPERERTSDTQGVFPVYVATYVIFNRYTVLVEMFVVITGS